MDFEEKLATFEIDKPKEQFKETVSDLVRERNIPVTNKVKRLLEAEAQECKQKRYTKCQECNKSEPCCMVNCKFFDDMYYLKEKDCTNLDICRYCSKYQYSECSGIDYINCYNTKLYDIEEVKQYNKFAYNLFIKAGIKEINHKTFLLCKHSKYKKDKRIINEIAEQLLRKTNKVDVGIKKQGSKCIIFTEGKSAFVDISNQEVLSNNGVNGWIIEEVIASYV